MENKSLLKAVPARRSRIAKVNEMIQMTLTVCTPLIWQTYISSIPYIQLLHAVLVCVVARGELSRQNHHLPSQVAPTPNMKVIILVVRLSHLIFLRTVRGICTIEQLNYNP